ncbi:putative MFS family arabinose efflux permease [Frondihabitans sp. PhB188]|uniref:MFS transporter n=1 Tax=Frondihabitans sp. PhB188 TaxID=2485200 RepID=UPI000F482E44|nr:MFS transporter [Frondihabitans sp. PhB188]ROQ40016.1 putative MFS family arabinose efflux permease [Frondihabitans sp. PhB188]
MSTAAVDTSSPGVLSKKYILATLGMCALIGISAFEALAVTTVMPTVSRELDGESLYAFAFAAPLASGLVGMVVAGNWADRRGPRPVVLASTLLFAVGLLVVGLAPSMTVLLIGRLIQGLGSGAVIVGLYVMVSQVFPERLHSAVFAGFAAAWVLPGLVGPVIAGTVTQTVGWHWVFIGALGLCVPAFLMILPTLRRLEPSDTRAPWRPARILWALGAAAAIVALNLISELPDLLGALVVVASVAALAVTLRPLLPKKTLGAGTGIPALVLLRGLVGAAFIGGDVYIPYLLSSHYGFSPAASGVTLTSGAVSWAFASWLVGRIGERVPQLTGLRTGIALMIVGGLSAVATPLWHLHPVVIIIGWTILGFGIGFVYSRFSVLTLRWSKDSEKGFNSSALTISDSASAAVVLGVNGALFGLIGGPGDITAFVACFAVAALVAVVALIVSGRGIPVGRRQG